MATKESRPNDAAKAASEEPADLQPSESGYRITELHVSNVLRLVAIDVTPPDDYVEVVGDNAQGKTSTLNAIESVLVGAKAFPDEFVHRGKREGKIDARLEAVEPDEDELPAFRVKRRVSGKGGMKIELTRPDGAPIARPQEFLDKLIGKITFDPLEFLRDKTKRVATMLQITELEDKLEANRLERKELFDKRTLVSRSLRDKQGALKELPVPKNAPDELVDTAQLVANRAAANADLEARKAHDTVLEGLLEEESASKDGVERQETLVADLEAQLANQREVLERKRSEYGAAVDNRTAKQGEILKLDPVNLFEEIVAKFDDQLANAGELNARFETARQYREKAQEVDDAEKEKEELSELIEALDNERNELFENADYPVEGMRFGEDDLTIDGLPFTQRSDAEKLRISMEIAAATNPQIRVILLRRANDLDNNALEVVKAFAKEKRFQIWAEKIHPSDAPAIVLEEGEAVSGTAVSS